MTLVDASILNPGVPIAAGGALKRAVNEFVSVISNLEMKACTIEEIAGALGTGSHLSNAMNPITSDVVRVIYSERVQVFSSLLLTFRARLKMLLHNYVELTYLPGQTQMPYIDSNVQNTVKVSLTGALEGCVDFWYSKLDEFFGTMCSLLDENIVMGAQNCSAIDEKVTTSYAQKCSAIDEKVTTSVAVTNCPTRIYQFPTFDSENKNEKNVVKFYEKETRKVFYGMRNLLSLVIQSYCSRYVIHFLENDEGLRMEMSKKLDFDQTLLIYIEKDIVIKKKVTKEISMAVQKSIDDGEKLLENYDE